MEYSKDLSVIITSYNHAETIRKALDSVLAQKLDLTYEILIFDDASNDGTKEIIIEYAKRFPQIRLFIKKYNNCRPTKDLYRIVKEKAIGRYLAFLDGDDCWISNSKLMEQYVFLEQNNKYSAVTTDARCEDQDGIELSRTIFAKKDNQVFSLADYAHLGNPGRFSSLFCRNPFLENMDCKIWYQADYFMGDYSIYAILLLMGDIYQFDKKMVLYRFVSEEGKINYNSLIIDDKYRPLKNFRYWIRLENYIRRRTNTDYKITNIDDILIRIASEYKWRDVFKAVSETDVKMRLVKAALFHFIPNTGTIYDNSGRKVGKNRSWFDFEFEKRPLVLFGAGIWASEFLDNYSWRKVVRFIVDNDEKKVGRSYKGYVIKNPNEILNFNGKIAVLITSGNHEEDIKKQLENMGIHDYYCYYSMQEKRVINRMLRSISKQ